jgi:hypothetical protein
MLLPYGASDLDNEVDRGAQEGQTMKCGKRLGAWVFGLVSLVSASVSWSAPETPHVAGNVLGLDASRGSIVVGDMGPSLDDGQGPIIRRSIRVTSSTEFTRVARADGVAPSGWIGDYVATKLSPWDVKPGDFVAITVKPGQDRPEAIEITVVDTSTPGR